MKKQLLFMVACSLAAVTASAQITITTADIETPNHVVYQANDTLPTTISVGNASASTQTWTMTALTADRKDTLNFIPYAWQPNTNFPTSNVVIKQGSANQYAFGLNDANGFSFLGNGGTANIMGTNITVNQISTPAEKLVTFPYTLNSSFTNNYASHAKFYFGQTVQGYQVDSVRDYTTVKKTAVVDAYGSLTTPLGTFPVIRSKETKLTTDSTDAYIVILTFGTWQNVQVTHDSTTTYTWWANGVGFPLVTATMDSAGAVKNVAWLLQTPSLGINEYSSGAENVYPNPAQNEINFVADAAKQKSIQVFDITGRLVDTYLITENVNTLNTSAYANGLYTYSILGKDNSIISRGKFSIAK
jgi:Secretion system C-terminal sorting domain